VFDQLVTPVAFYLSRGEVEAWFRSPGFDDVALRWHNQMSWTATATVRADAFAAAARTEAGTKSAPPPVAG
jgi:hypothetical protein